MNQSAVTLDVREDIRHGREPFARITAAVARLMPNQDLLLIAPFEPVPLFHILAQQGFNHNARQNATGDWEVLFTRRGGPSTNAGNPSEAAPRDCPGTQASHTINLDARGLEPPQPMVNILEALTSLPADAQLDARTDRRPVHLYTLLEERSFSAQTEQHPDGGFITHIRRR